MTKSAALSTCVSYAVDICLLVPASTYKASGGPVQLGIRKSRLSGVARTFAAGAGPARQPMLPWIRSADAALGVDTSAWGSPGGLTVPGVPGRLSADSQRNEENHRRLVDEGALGRAEPQLPATAAAAARFLPRESWP